MSVKPRLSVKETLHQWVDELPEDSPTLLSFYEQLLLDRAITEAKADVAAGRMMTLDEVRARYEEKCRQRRSK